jgi:hypothetical protein
LGSKGPSQTTNNKHTNNQTTHLLECYQNWKIVPIINFFFNTTFPPVLNLAKILPR